MKTVKCTFCNGYGSSKTNQGMKCRHCLGTGTLNLLEQQVSTDEFYESCLTGIKRTNGGPEDVFNATCKVIQWMHDNNVYMLNGLVVADMYRNAVLEDAAQQCDKRVTNEACVSRLDDEARACARAIRILKNK